MSKPLLRIKVPSGQTGFGPVIKDSVTIDQFLKKIGKENEDIDYPNMSTYDSVNPKPYLDFKPWNKTHQCVGSGGIYVPLKDGSRYTLNAYPQRHTKPEHVGYPHWAVPININQISSSGSAKKMGTIDLSFDVRHVPWKNARIKLYLMDKQQPFVNTPVSP